MKRVAVIDDTENAGSEVGDEAPEAQKRKSIQSVEYGVRLLEVLAAAPGTLALRDVAKAGRMSRSQTHRYLLSYVNTGLVRQDPATGDYELGPVALRIGLSALRRCEPIAVANEALSALIERTGHTGLVTVWGEYGPTIVRLAQGRRPVVMSLQVGSTVPIFGSAAGHIFLAHLPRSVATAAAKQAWKNMNPDNPNGWKAMLAKFEHEVRVSNFASVCGTTIPGLSAIGAPVLDSQGQIVAVIGLVAHSDVALEQNSDAIAALKDASHSASERLGYEPNAEFEND